MKTEIIIEILITLFLTVVALYIADKLMDKIKVMFDLYIEHERIKAKFLSAQLKQLEYINTNLAVLNLKNEEIEVQEKVEDQLDLFKSQEDWKEVSGNFVRMVCKYDDCREAYNHEIKVTFEKDIKSCPKCNRIQ